VFVEDSHSPGLHERIDRADRPVRVGFDGQGSSPMALASRAPWWAASLHWIVTTIAATATAPGLSWRLPMPDRLLRAPTEQPALDLLSCQFRALEQTVVDAAPATPPGQIRLHRSASAITGLCDGRRALPPAVAAIGPGGALVQTRASGRADRNCQSTRTAHGAEAAGNVAYAAPGFCAPLTRPCLRRPLSTWRRASEPFADPARRFGDSEAAVARCSGRRRPRWPSRPWYARVASGAEVQGCVRCHP